jgi:hypothetical protein
MDLLSAAKNKEWDKLKVRRPLEVASYLELHRESTAESC